MMLFFLSGMVEGQLLSTGAFEVSFNSKTLSITVLHFKQDYLKSKFNFIAPVLHA